jgi:predicted nicotinamide N-methyase
MDPAVAFVRAHTRLRTTPFVPEVRLHVADDIGDLWERTAVSPREDCAPPFWAFPWAGGQAVARHVLDHPGLVAGRRVLDLASGSGLVAVAAVLAGATTVVANDVDPYAAAAVVLNAQANGVEVRVRLDDLLVGGLDEAYDVVLAGDVCYSRELAERVIPWLTAASERGALVLLGDPGRTYAPAHGYAVVATYDVPVAESLEDTGVKRTTILTPS